MFGVELLCGIKIGGCERKRLLWFELYGCQRTHRNITRPTHMESARSTSASYNIRYILVVMLSEYSPSHIPTFSTSIVAENKCDTHDPTNLTYTYFARVMYARRMEKTM